MKVGTDCDSQNYLSICDAAGTIQCAELGQLLAALLGISKPDECLPDLWQNRSTIVLMSQIKCVAQVQVVLVTESW